MLVPLRGWLLLCFLIGMGMLSYYRMYGELPVPSSDDETARVKLAQRWAQKVASEVHRLQGRPLVAVARVVNDSDGILTAQLKAWIARRNVRLVNDQWYTGIGYSMGISGEPATVEQAITPLVGQDVDYIVAAEISNWTTFPEFESVLQGRVEFRDGRKGNVVFECQLNLADAIAVMDDATLAADRVDTNSSLSVVKNVQADAANPDIVAEATESKSRQPTPVDSHQVPPAMVGPRKSPPTSEAELNPMTVGMVLWLGSVISMPLLAATRLRRLLAKRHNRANFSLLASWVLVTGVLAVVLWVRLLPMVQGLMTGLVAVLMGMAYFGFCCQCIERAS